MSGGVCVCGASGVVVVDELVERGLDLEEAGLEGHLQQLDGLEAESDVGVVVGIEARIVARKRAHLLESAARLLLGAHVHAQPVGPLAEAGDAPLAVHHVLGVLGVDVDELELLFVARLVVAVLLARRADVVRRVHLDVLVLVHDLRHLLGHEAQLDAQLADQMLERVDAVVLDRLHLIACLSSSIIKQLNNLEALNFFGFDFCIAYLDHFDLPVLSRQLDAAARLVVLELGLVERLLVLGYLRLELLYVALIGRLAAHALLRLVQTVHVLLDFLVQLHAAAAVLVVVGSLVRQRLRHLLHAQLDLYT